MHKNYKPILTILFSGMKKNLPETYYISLIDMPYRCMYALCKSKFGCRLFAVTLFNCVTKRMIQYTRSTYTVAVVNHSHILLTIHTFILPITHSLIMQDKPSM